MILQFPFLMFSSISVHIFILFNEQIKNNKHTV